MRQQTEGGAQVGVVLAAYEGGHDVLGERVHLRRVGGGEEVERPTRHYVELRVFEVCVHGKVGVTGSRRRSGEGEGEGRKNSVRPTQLGEAERGRGGEGGVAR